MKFYFKIYKHIFCNKWNKITLLKLVFYYKDIDIIYIYINIAKETESLLMEKMFTAITGTYFSLMRCTAHLVCKFYCGITM